MRRREGVSPRALKKFKFNSLLSLSCFSAFTFSLARTMLILGPPKDGAASPPRPAADFRTGLCAAARPPRRGFCFSWQRPGRCATWPGAVRVRARACARVRARANVCALSNVVIFRLFLSPSLSENTCVPQQQEKKVNLNVVYLFWRTATRRTGRCLCV